MRNFFYEDDQPGLRHHASTHQAGAVGATPLLGILLAVVTVIAAYLFYDKMRGESSGGSGPDKAVLYKAEPAPLQARVDAVERFFDQAEEALRRGEHQQAIIKFNSAAGLTQELLGSTQLGAHEQSVRELLAAAHRGAGECYFELAQYERAQEQYENTLEITPDDDLVRGRLAQCLLARDFHVAARARLRELVARESSHPAALTAHGQYLVSVKKDIPQARATLRKVLEQDPRLAEALFWLGRAEEKAGNARAALEAFQAAAEGFTQTLVHRPQALRWRSYRSVCFVRLGQYADAVADLNEVLSSESRSAVAYANRGFCMLQLGHSRQAVDDLKAALLQNPKMVSAHLNLGDAHAFEQNYEEAISCYTRALELDPVNPVALHNRALAYRGLEDYDAAMADLERALELEPESPSIHHAIGSVHLVRGFFQRAIHSYSAVLEFNPADAVAHIRRGSAQYAAGFYQDAVEDFTQAIAKGKPTVEVLGRRAVAYHALGQFQEALADVNQAIELEPGDHRLFSLRAGLKHNLGRPEAAVEDLKKAMDLNRGSGIASEVQSSEFSTPTPVPN
jgi:tetratricopeptide (TPR) repeat protein